jgi:ubiquinone/menaquinone biosynthesis C-methylase UbiE
MKFILTEEQIVELEQRFDWRIPLRITDLDCRVEEASKIISFYNKSVLDVGTLDGHITVSLAYMNADNIDSIDCRASNLAMGFARCFSLGCNMNRINFILGDIENLPQDKEWDIIFHSGVFYHVHNPMKHLMDLTKHFSEYLVLETHTANPKTQINGIMEEFNTTFNGTFYPESGMSDPGGAKNNEYSFWMTHESIEQLFKICKLKVKATIYKDKFCEAGPRSCWILERE